MNTKINEEMLMTYHVNEFNSILSRLVFGEIKFQMKYVGF